MKCVITIFHHGFIARLRCKILNLDTQSTQMNPSSVKDKKHIGTSCFLI